MSGPQKPTMSTEAILRTLATPAHPVLLPDGSFAKPAKIPFRADLSHIALGLWAGYLFVLFCPGKRGSEALSEKHLVQGFSGMMNVFPLV